MLLKCITYFRKIYQLNLFISARLKFDFIVVLILFLRHQNLHSFFLRFFLIVICTLPRFTLWLFSFLDVSRCFRPHLTFCVHLLLAFLFLFEPLFLLFLIFFFSVFRFDLFCLFGGKNFFLLCNVWSFFLWLNVLLVVLGLDFVLDLILIGCASAIRTHFFFLYQKIFPNYSKIRK